MDIAFVLNHDTAVALSPGVTASESDVGTGPDVNMPEMLDRCCPTDRLDALPVAAAFGRSQLIVARPCMLLDNLEMMPCGPWNALFRCNGARAVFFERSCESFCGQRFSLSPVSAGTTPDGSQYRSCNIRKGSKFIRSKGILSAWKGRGGFGLIWSDPVAVHTFVCQNWSLSHEDRNRLMHALNGNGKRFKQRRRESKDEQAVNTASFPVSFTETRVVQLLNCEKCGSVYPARDFEQAALDAGLDITSVCSFCEPPRSRARDRSLDCPDAPSFVPLSPIPEAGADPSIASVSSPPEGTNEAGKSGQKKVTFKPPTPEPTSSIDTILYECVYGDVRGCFGRACGSARDSQPAIHFGGLDDPRDGDEVLTCEFEEYADQMEGMPAEMSYRRVGHDYSFAEGLYGTSECADWMFEHGCVRHYRSVSFFDALEVMPISAAVANLFSCRRSQWAVSLARCFATLLQLVAFEYMLFVSFVIGPAVYAHMEVVARLEGDINGQCERQWLVWGGVVFWFSVLCMVLTRDQSGSRLGLALGLCGLLFAAWCSDHRYCASRAVVMGEERKPLERVTLFPSFPYPDDLFGWSQRTTLACLLFSPPLFMLCHLLRGWLNTFEGLCCNTYLRAVLLGQTKMDPPLYHYRLRETYYDGRQSRRRFSSYTTNNGIVSMFRGRKRSIVWYLHHVVEVSSSVLGETLRYFSSDLPARVCASHITGHLKNSDASSEQIHACIAAAAAHHGVYSKEYAETLDRKQPEGRQGWRQVVYLIAFVLLAVYLCGSRPPLNDLSEFPEYLKMAHGYGWTTGTGVDDWEVTIGSIFYRTRYRTYSSNSSLCVNVTIEIDRTWEHLGLYKLVAKPQSGNICFSPSVSDALRTYFNITPEAEPNFWNAYTHHATFENIIDHSRRMQQHSRFYAYGAFVFLVLFVTSTYDCSIAPWWEERFKASYGWITVFIFVAAEAAARVYGGMDLAFYLRTTGLAHCVFYGFTPFMRWLNPKYARDVPDAAYLNAFALHRIWNCMFSQHNFLYVAVLVQSLDLAFAECQRRHYDWVDVPSLLVESWCFVCFRFSGLSEFRNFVGAPPDWWYSLFELRIVFPGFVQSAGLVASLGPFGWFLAAQASSYLRGGLSMFTDVPAMGEFSRFREWFRSGAVPVRDDATIRLRPGRRQRGRNRLLRIMPEFVPVASFAGNDANALHSLCGRVVNKTPDCTCFPLMTAELVEEMADRMMERGPIRVISSSEWAHSFPRAKRNRYLMAIEKLSVFGIAWFYAPFEVCTKWYKRSCFIKHEANLAQLDKRTPYGFVACADPRTIQASTDEVQALFGPSFVSYGQRASEVFDGSERSKIHGWRVLFGFGRTKSEVSRYCDDMAACGERAVVDCGDDSLIVVGGRVYAVDARRWDAHIRRPLLEIKTLHLRKLGMSERMMHVLVRMIKRRGTYTGLGVGFETDGNVASGDPDTLYWNTVLGVALIIACFDGCTTFDGFEKRALELGVEYELAGSAHVGFPGRAIDFCSCVIAPTLGGWTFAPKLGRYLMKLGVSAIRGNPLHLLSAKLRGAICDLAAYPEIVGQLCRLSSHLPTRDAVHESYFPVGKCDPGTPAERHEMFAERYGVEYSSVVDEVSQLVDSTLAGDMQRGDLVNLRRLVEVDYGKAPLETGVGAASRRGRSRLWVFFCLLAVVGGAVIFGARSSIRKYTSSVSWPGVMAGKKMKSKQQGKKAPMSNGKSKAKVKGSGNYAVASLAAGAIADSVKSQLRKAFPPGTFEKAGGNLGRRLGRGLSTITGVGDYVLNDTFTNNANNIKNGMETQTISNCEYCFEIQSDGSPGFDVFRQPINPANKNLFPWLSRFSNLYTKYRFKQLIFEFRSTSSDYAANAGLGSVIFAPQYNINLDAFATKQTMQAATHAVSTKPSNSMMCGLECSPKDQNYKWLYTRAYGDEPLVTTDLGWFNWALYGCPASNGVAMGEVWVHYTVEMVEPIIPKEIGVLAKRASLLSTNTTAGEWTKWLGINSATFGNLLDVTYNALTPACTMLWSVTNTVPGTYDFNFLSGGKRVYFAPGLWVIEYVAFFSTAPTTYPVINFTTGDGAVIVTGSSEAGTYPNSVQSSDFKVFNQLFMVQVSKKGGWVDTGSNSTNSSSAVMASGTVRFTRFDAGY